jgi:hypothetical protein
MFLLDQIDNLISPRIGRLWVCTRLRAVSDHLQPAGDHRAGAGAPVPLLCHCGRYASRKMLDLDPGC